MAKKKNIREKFGRYQVVELLGTGGMGAVYLAEDPVLDRKLAIKIIEIDSRFDEDALQEFLNRFMNEAQASAKLSHPSIVTVHDAGDEEGHPWIAFEYVEGSSLEDILLKEKKLHVARALSLVKDITSALCHAHERGIIHRDVKPSNILVDCSNLAKLADFGIAKAPWSRFTKKGSTLGSPGYMSPEQIKGSELDGRSDLFSMGIVFYEMLSGIHPFYRETVEATALATLAGEYTPLTEIINDIPAQIDYIIARCLSSVLENRVDSASELLELLPPVDTPDKPITSSKTPPATRARGSDVRDVATQLSERRIGLDQISSMATASESGLATRSRSFFTTFLTSISHKRMMVIWLSIGLMISTIFALSVYKLVRDGQFGLPRESLSTIEKPTPTPRIESAVEKKLRKLRGIVRSGELHAALSACQELTKMGYKCPRERFDIELTRLMEGGKPDEAQVLAARLADLRSTAALGYFTLTRLAMQKKDFDAAKNACANLQKSKSGRSMIQKELGVLLREMTPSLSGLEATPDQIEFVSKNLRAARHLQVNIWLSSEDYWLRWNAVKILESAGAPVDFVNVYILDLKHGDKWQIRKNAAEKLGELKDDRAIPALEEAGKAKFKDPVVARTARSVLKNSFDHE